MILRTVLLIGASLLTAAIFAAMASETRTFWRVVADLLAEPWAAVTLIDLYLGFFVSATIIIFAERRLWAGLFWAIPVFLLGNSWTAIWLVIRQRSIRARLRGGS